MPNRVKWAIHKAVRTLVYDGLRLMPTAVDATLPYQAKLPAPLMAAIDDGSMHLISYCNSEHSSKLVPWRYVRSQILRECRIPGSAMFPVDLRKLSARINNTTIYNIRGPEARFISWHDLWNAVSPWDNENQKGVRFSLPTAVMVLRLVGMKHTIEPADFLHYDHPENNITCDVENRLNNSGYAFTITKKVAEAWNAMVYRQHGEPPRGTTAYEKVLSECFTSRDIQETVAALSRLIHTHPDQFTQQSNLFFALRKTPTQIKHVDAAKLFQPVATLESDQQIELALRRYAEYTNGDWSETGIVTKDPTTCAPNGNITKVLGSDKSTYEVKALGHFMWEQAKDDAVTNSTRKRSYYVKRR
jgi:hypothetical protein